MVFIDINVFVILVSIEGCREWMRILCFVIVNISSVIVFLGLRFWSSVENFLLLLVRVRIYSKNKII